MSSVATFTRPFRGVHVAFTRRLELGPSVRSVKNKAKEGGHAMRWFGALAAAGFDASLEALLLIPTGGSRLRHLLRREARG